MHFLSRIGRKPKLSVIVIFHNMRREAPRTLLSLTVEYQQNLKVEDYEVLIFDSSSSSPLDGEWVQSLQSNFKYFCIDSDDPTPCEAMNIGIAEARADTVVCHIDGARILSPNILSLMLKSNQIYNCPFSYTIGMHLGSKIQNISVTEGYCQAEEDLLLNSISWESNGYLLFERACLAASSAKGYFGSIKESNCFAVDKKLIESIGGFDRRFKSPGGGVVNLDVFKQLYTHKISQPVMLLGEATFHQFHGGVATNVSMENHPIEKFLKEYAEIRGEQKNPFSYPQNDHYHFGIANKYSKPFIFS